MIGSHTGAGAAQLDIELREGQRPRLLRGGGGLVLGPEVLRTTVPGLALPLGAPLREVAPGLYAAEADGLLLGVCREGGPGGPEGRARRAYGRIFEAVAGHNLLRLWNFIPGINDRSSGTETYRSFCVGRHEAFRAAFGPHSEPRMPAASGVGCAGDSIDVLFLAVRADPVHLENPRQVPAYAYPVEHGPRPPSFARASLARVGGLHIACISGTASIRGHASQFVGNLQGQLAVTADNLLGMCRQLKGHGYDTAAARRTFVTYVRHRRDLPQIATFVDADLADPGDARIFVEADICRRELDVEIEVTLVKKD